ncbi:hypothetical protein [Companilactobacillus nantensis]|uniref:Surface layer protein A domain-containing protein n=1 Tax=Companilactobacillus nantensis DSM 16982 TaxID=1423774 RepID=A0A0R1WG84_9LACO|nr:hypothetical protein [Companilactobacillus nantensis]KRM14745.1 hypothetical protein FD31_GL001680 [Companilactobacillus nantensis DSM 16982]GEO65074.1 hypothetical protein LNA01_22570 [Companilactobacillus nantensis]
MKLGKTLIITGLLFSSVLGSVNVNNITAMAAVESGDSGTTAPEAKRTVSISYVDSHDNAITDTEFLGSAKGSVDISKNATSFSTSELKLPVNYKTVNDTEKDTISVENTTTARKVQVENIEKKTVKAQYQDATGKEITNPGLNDTRSLINPTKQVTASNLDAVSGYEFLKYDAEKDVVIFQAITKANVQILFIDGKGNLLNVKRGQVANKNISELVSDKEVTAPNGYVVSSGQNVVIASASADNNTTVYSAKIKIEPKATVSTHKVGHRGGYTVQRVRISFIDQDGNEAGYQQLNGKDTFSAKIAAPVGYSLVNSSDATIKFDKKGNKDIKINVTKNKPTPVMSEGIVTTNSGEYFHLYTIEGKDITNRGLSGDSKWYTDQYATINGEKMYRVATNEWVKATDVYK